MRLAPTFVTCEDFREIAKIDDGKVKPLVFMSVNWRPDEPSKNQQTMVSGVRHFTLYGVEKKIIFAHPLGSGTYNKVEQGS